MTLTGVVITGTSGSGKSSLARSLCECDNAFALAAAVTTRKPRPSDRPGDYRFLSVEEFEAQVEQLIVATTYRGNKYGIQKSEIDGIARRNRIPVLVVAPDCLAASRLGLPGKASDPVPEFLSVFLDAPDEVLEARLIERDGQVDAKALSGQLQHDRTFAARALYRPRSGDVEDVVKLIRSAWRGRGESGILRAADIEIFIRLGILLEEGDPDRVQGASYDLSLGDEYYYRGKIHRLSERTPFLLIEPYDYAIVTSNELPNLPANVAGRFDLSVGLFCQGLILSNGPQVDPGFRGPLFCLLFNTSSSPVLLKRRQHYATLEFHRLSAPTVPYRGSYQGKELLHYLPVTAAQGAISDLKHELEEVRKESRRLQELTWVILSIIVALLALFVALD